ncbi:MAG: sulfatase [Planctomycetota bacterium]|nr:sulfatase [Planctomycetota bacterium]
MHHSPHRHNNRTTAAWITLVVAFWASLSACGSEAHAQDKKSNVLIIVLDTLRADHLSCYGYEKDTSPHLKAFADRSVVFEGAQSSAPWTAPSLISMMTSLYPDVHGVSDNTNLTSLPQKVDTLAEVLGRRGYATAAFTEGGYAKAAFGLGQGFDLFPSNMGDEISYSAYRHAPSRLMSNTDRMLEWLEQRTPEQPFFGFFQTYEIHAPFRAPEEFVRRYQPDFDQEQEHSDCAAAIEEWNANRKLSKNQLRLMQRHLLHCAFVGMPELQHAQEWLASGAEHDVELHRSRMGEDPDLVNWVTNLYDAEIAYTDFEMQRLWRALDESGQIDNTIVIVVSDHGESLGDHEQLEHGSTLYEELLNVAFIVHAPGRGIEPARIQYPARTIDIYPTVLELLDVGSGATQLQGQSLVDVMHGKPTPAPPSFAQADAWGIDMHAVLDDGWRLIVDNKTDAKELYHLVEDPKESNNLLLKHPDVAQRLATAIAKQRATDAKLRQRIGAGQDAAEVDEATQKELQGLGYGHGHDQMSGD